MKKVYVIESFEDLRKACLGIRTQAEISELPMMEEDAQLIIRGSSLILKSELFVIADDIKHKAREFVEWCVNNQVQRAKFRDFF